MVGAQAQGLAEARQRLGAPALLGEPGAVGDLGIGLLCGRWGRGLRVNVRGLGHGVGCEKRDADLFLPGGRGWRQQRPARRRLRRREVEGPGARFFPQALAKDGPA